MKGFASAGGAATGAEIGASNAGNVTGRP